MQLKQKWQQVFLRRRAPVREQVASLRLLTVVFSSSFTARRVRLCTTLFSCHRCHCQLSLTTNGPQSELINLRTFSLRAPTDNQTCCVKMNISNARGEKKENVCMHVTIIRMINLIWGIRAHYSQEISLSCYEWSVLLMMCLLRLSENKCIGPLI